MAYDKQLDQKLTRFHNRILDLEKASVAQDRAIKQLAEKTGVAVDLTRVFTREEVSAQVRAEKSAERLLEDKEVLALLGEVEKDDAQ